MCKIIVPIAALYLIGLGLSALYAYGEKPAGAALEYESNGKRDPFIPLIGQEKAKKISGLLEDITSIEDIKLEGIAMGASGKNAAILNGRMVKDNDVFGALRIKNISQSTVHLSIEGKDYTLKLPKPEEEKRRGEE